MPAALKPDNVTPYSITYNTGTTFQVFMQSAADNFNLSRQVNINGEVTIRNNATLPATIASPINLNGNITLTANAATSALTFTGDINQQGTGRMLTKQSANTVTLTGLGNYTGPTTMTPALCSWVPTTALTTRRTWCWPAAFSMPVVLTKQ